MSDTGCLLPPEMTEKQIKAIARDLATALRLADVNPAKDTLCAAIDKFKDRNFRTLTLHIKGGGLMFLCSDPEMSARIHQSIERESALIYAERGISFTDVEVKR